MNGFLSFIKDSSIVVTISATLLGALIGGAIVVSSTTHSHCSNQSAKQGEGSTREEVRKSQGPPAKIEYRPITDVKGYSTKEETITWYYKMKKYDTKEDIQTSNSNLVEFYDPDGKGHVVYSWTDRDDTFLPNLSREQEK